MELTSEAGLKCVSNTLEAISTSDLSTWLPMTVYMKKVIERFSICIYSINQ